MYYVYILRSRKDNKFYIGSTSDVEARLRFHNSGLQRSTRHRIPFELVHVEEFAGKKIISSILALNSLLVDWQVDFLSQFFKQLMTVDIRRRTHNPDK